MFSNCSRGHQFLRKATVLLIALGLAANQTVFATENNALKKTRTLTKKAVVPDHSAPSINQIALLDGATDAQIEASTILSGGLIATKGKSNPSENQALIRALRAYALSNGTDFNELCRFITQFPNSRWTASIQSNVAAIYSAKGYWSKALPLWESAWYKAKAETRPQAQWLADEAITNFLFINAQVGRLDVLDKYLPELSERAFIGPHGSRMTTIRQGYQRLKYAPGDAYRCGPLAIQTLALNAKISPALACSTTEKLRSTRTGTNLAQIAQLAKQLKLDFQPAKRTTGAPPIVPSVAHWKLGHFGAIIRSDRGNLVLHDPTFHEEGRKTITPEVLDVESDGYFLVPSGPLPPGWRKISLAEAATIWGKGATQERNRREMVTGAPELGAAGAGGGSSDGAGGGAGTTACSAGGQGGGGGASGSGGTAAPGGAAASSGWGTAGFSEVAGGMPTLTVWTMQVRPHIVDIPLAYSNPIGPAMVFRLNYNFEEQPATNVFSVRKFMVSPDWCFNWNSFVQVKQDSSTSAFVFVRGGGSEYFEHKGSVSFTYPEPDRMSHAKLSAVKDSSGFIVTKFIRELPDGTIEEYSEKEGTNTNDRFWLTKVTDPYNQSVSISYDTNHRATTLTDPLGQQTTFTYASTNPSSDGYYRLAEIEDPFGRTCSITYSSDYMKLESITDQIGLKSSFEYNPQSSLIEAMTTPYGKTLIEQYVPNISHQNGWEPIGLRITSPDGSVTRTESHISTGLAHTYFWSRENSQHYPDTNAAAKYKWMLDAQWGGRAEAIIDEMRPPIVSGAEAPKTVFTYKGEFLAYPTTGGNSVPSMFNEHELPSNRPITKTKVATDSSQQQWQYTWNDIGNLTSTKDPLNRQANFTYASNMEDLLKVESASGDVLARWTYSGHKPITATNASGRSNSMTYNSYGQLTSITDPDNNTTSFNYGTISGISLPVFLTSINGPLSGGADVVSFDYDSVHRLNKVTDANGYAVLSEFDDADRVTKTIYPDSTDTRTVYSKLDPVLFKDRAGRWSGIAYDSLRQITETTDPSGRRTKYAFCHCGGLSKLIDPNGNTTRWEYDRDARLKRKIFASGDDVLFSYDKFSRLATKQDSTTPTRQSTNYSYNSDDSLHSITFTNAINSTPETEFHYDATYFRTTSIDTKIGGSTVGTESYSYNPYVNAVTTNKAFLWAGGSPESGDTITFTINNASLSGGSYTLPAIAVTATESGDPAKLAALIANAIHSDGTLSAAGIDASPLTPGTNQTMVTITGSGTTTVSSSSIATTGNTTISVAGGGAVYKVANNYPSSTTTYSYDSLGRTAVRTINGADHVTKTTYDQISRITGISNPLGSFSIGYVDPGKGLNQIATITYPGSAVTTSFSWFPNALDNSLQQIVNSTSSGIASKFGYSYGSDGQILQWQQMQNSVNSHKILEYNPSGELITAQSAAGLRQTVVLSGTSTVSDIINLTFTDIGLTGSGGVKTISHELQTGETLVDAAQQLTTAINNSANGLTAIGISATQSGSTVKIESSSAATTTLRASVTRGSGTPSTLVYLEKPRPYGSYTDQLYYAYDCSGNRLAEQQTAGNGTGSSTSISGSGFNCLNQLLTTSAGGLARFRGQANKALKSASANSKNLPLPTTKEFEGNAPLSASSTSTATVSVIDGRNATHSENFSVNVTGPSTSNFAYDANGNMTSDGVHSYSWDATDRLIKITYNSNPDDNTQFDYDALGHCIKITERTNGSIESISEFIWCGTERCQQINWDASHTNVLRTTRFCEGGTQVTDASLGTLQYLHTYDHLGSVRESFESGTLQAQYSYTPFGVQTKIAGAGPDPDFGFAGMCQHQRSGLNLTFFRVYSPGLSRWLTRDPAGDLIRSTNLYEYAANNPVILIDPLGLQPSLGTVATTNVHLEQGTNTYGLTHIIREHGPSVMPFGNTVQRGVFTREAWESVYMNRMLQRILGACPGDPRVTVEHDTSRPDQPRDIYTANMAIVTRDAQTGVVTAVRPIGHVYSPSRFVGPPSLTFNVTIVVNARTNNIITMYPSLP